MSQANESTARETAGRIASYGRGGAGNLGKDQSFVQPEDLVTPTIKSNTYTSGRGGAGNMRENDPAHPEIARAAQDVDGPAHKPAPDTAHVGRGGAGNVASANNAMGSVEQQHQKQGRKGSFTGAMDKAKEALGLGKKQ